jgi:hypothetical protein
MLSPSVFARFCRHLRSGGTRIRTGDTMIFSHVLYQLSYPARKGSGVILRHEVVAIKRPTGRRA